MTTILIFNAISSLLAAVGLGGYVAHRRRRERAESAAMPLLVTRQRRR
jgi:hypothetical protein